MSRICYGTCDIDAYLRLHKCKMHEWSPRRRWDSDVLHRLFRQSIGAYVQNQIGIILRVRNELPICNLDESTYRLEQQLVPTCVLSQCSSVDAHYWRGFLVCYRLQRDQGRTYYSQISQEFVVGDDR